jgi:hypothetical protein
VQRCGCASQPHYLIETIGMIRRIVDEGRVAYQAKIEQSEARLYMLKHGTTPDVPGVRDRSERLPAADR